MLYGLVIYINKEFIEVPSMCAFFVYIDISKLLQY